ncbi:hypothetical protein [Desulfuribacillus alkaliarsenatis]|uniref:hypothetical protein n=1 Tax=Desulfuribacillus alkaliarsenatis TaxID=766136 RepID=UPI000A029B78|nr:hypothetical protein [Desulfuribacillus alkaliarsenatis]
MNKVSWFKDLLHDRMYQQRFFNDWMLLMTNPEARQTFAQMRDDEMRFIILLQQKIDTMTRPKEAVTISPFK